MRRSRSRKGYLRSVVMVLLLLYAASASAQAPNWETLASMGSQALRDGRYAEAAQQFKAALAVAETLPPDDPRVAASLTNLADAYRVQGQYAPAVPLYERALQLRERILGPSHPRVADVLEAYADLLRRQHPWLSGFPWSAAAKMTERARRIRRLLSADEERPAKPDPPDMWRWPEDEKELFGDSNA